MLPSDSDTIAAIATAPGRAAVGIVRVSGPGVPGVVKAICGKSLNPRQASYLPFLDASGQPIDIGLAIHFPAPHSYTGEDVLELQAHGGTIVLQLLLSRCIEAGRSVGVRLARPGEFTQRAFLNDKIDLAQAEAVADLLDASTEVAARSGSRSLSGAFSAEIQALLKVLIELRMLIEAAIDFPEEEVDSVNRPEVLGRLAALLAMLDHVRQKAKQGALLRDGIKVVIAGQPNSGKSSLLNALAGLELAIVSPIAGTTRDKIQQTIQIEGVPLHVIDTAGLRHSDDEVEKMGVERAWAEIESADAVVFLHDLTRLIQTDPAASAATDRADYMAGEARITATLAERLPPGVPVIDVWNKIDVASGSAVAASDLAVSISARTGEGLDVLRRMLLQVAGWQSVPEGVYMARERHVQALDRVRRHLETAVARLSGGAPQLDLLAEDLRLAQNALGEITGAFGSDDLLGEIFSRFCIGK